MSGPRGTNDQTIHAKGTRAMPTSKPGPSVKDDELYERLRDEGESKEKSARIANARARGSQPGRKGGKASDYEKRTVRQLRQQAAEIGIDGRSTMDKQELIDALRNH